MLARTLALLVAALAAGGISATSAFAGTVDVTPEITGAGSIAGTGDPEVVGCSQAAPVSGAVRKVCTNWTVSKGAAVASVVIRAAAAPGWEFDGWTGCYQEVRPYCELRAAAGDVTETFKPVAHFVDRRAPVVTTPSVTPDPDNEGYVKLDWSDSEPGVTYRCWLDGGSASTCRPGLRLHVIEGAHELSVYGTDASGNFGAVVQLPLPVVDTSLPVAPPEGAHRRGVAFEARSAAAGRFDCSLDGSAWVTCGLGSPGVSTPLVTQNLAEGRHTLRVRAVGLGTVDHFPASRSFTIDTTAPETTIRETAGGFALGADESAVTYRCRIDDRPYGPCEAATSLAPGTHTVEAFATDEAGNADATPAKHGWTVPEPPAAAAPVAPASAAAPAPAAPAPITAAPKPLSFTLRYRYAHGRLTRLQAVGLPAGTKLTVTVTCRARKGCPKSPTTLGRLVGKRLAPGTRITVRAGTTTRSITLPRRS